MPPHLNAGDLRELLSLETDLLSLSDHIIEDRLVCVIEMIFVIVEAFDAAHNKEAFLGFPRVAPHELTVDAESRVFRPCDVVSECDLVLCDHRPKDKGVNIHERLVDAPAVPASVFLQDRETERDPLLIELEEIVLVLVVVLDAVAFFAHAVWRIGENEVGALPVGCFLDVTHLQAVAAV